MNTVKFQGELEALGQRLQQTLLKLSPLLQLQVRCGIRQETLLILVEHLLHIEPDPEQTVEEIKQSLTEVAPDLFRSGLVQYATGHTNALPVRVYLRIVGYQEPYQSRAFTLEPLAPVAKPVVQPSAPARLATLPPPVPVILAPSASSSSVEEEAVDSVEEAGLPPIIPPIWQEQAQSEVQPEVQLDKAPEVLEIPRTAQISEATQADEETLELRLTEPPSDVAEEIAVVEEVETIEEIAVTEEKIAESEAHLVAGILMGTLTATPIALAESAIDTDEISHPEISFISKPTIFEVAEAESVQAEEVEPIALLEQLKIVEPVEAKELAQTPEPVEIAEVAEAESVQAKEVEPIAPQELSVPLKIAEPKIAEPEAIIDDAASEIAASEIAEAEIAEAEATIPELIEPEITELELTKAEIAEAKATIPEIAEPEIAEPEITELKSITDDAAFETTEPELTKAEIAEVEATIPELIEPEIAESEATLSKTAIADESLAPVSLQVPAVVQPDNLLAQHPSKPFGAGFLSTLSLSTLSFSTLMSGGAVGLFVLVSGAYFLTRPCVTGAVCEPLQKAQQLDQQASQTIATTDSALAVVQAYDQLTEASYLLGSIPSWSGHHQRAQTLQAAYESKSKVVGQVVKALKQANAAAMKSQNPPHPLPKWRQIQWDWREAIATLEKVPPDSPVLALSQKKLAEYKVNLATTNRRVLAEQSAQDKVTTARKTAAVAENRASIAVNSEGWQQVYLTWQAAIDLLQQVPQGTMAHAEAQQFINLYQSKMAKADNQRNQEQVSTGSYQEAVDLAKQARELEQQNQWTQAVGLWRKAVINVQQIPQGTTYYTQAQPLINEYQVALTQAEASLNRSSAMQSVKPDLNRACLGTGSAASKCTYTLSSDGIRIQITPQYDQAVENAIARAQIQGSASARTAVTAQVNELLQNLAKIGKTAQVPIELYGSDGSIFAKYAPEKLGYVAR